MSEIADPTLAKALADSDRKHPSTTETTGSVKSTSAFEEKQAGLQAWQKPGGWGATLRFLRKLQRYVWDDPDKSKQEKRFLFKLDFFLLTYCCLGYFSKGLAQSNISNAYISGMKQSLDMGGSELTYMSNVFTAGYVIGQIPAVILVTRIRPSILVPTAELCWSVATFACSVVTTVQQLYGLRFLVGFFEGAFFPVIIYVIGSWYTKEERAKRVTLFYSTATLSAMFSGFLQAAAYDNLNGHLGHAGWQWLFIITGVISLPSGLIGYIFCPDFPSNTRAFYLSTAEASWARLRLSRLGYNELGRSAWDRTKIFRIARQWQFWVLPVGYFFIQSSLPSQQPVFNLWLSAEGYSVYDANVLPSIGYGIAAILQVLAGALSDSPLLSGRRWQPIFFMQAGTFFAVVVLAIWNVPHGLKFAAYCLAWCCAGVPALYFSWFPELMPEDHEMRGFLIAFSNIFSYVNQIWYSDAVWRTVESPQFKPGFIAAAVTGVAIVLTTFLMRVLEIRDVKRRNRAVAGGPTAA